jgi:hypothetical protein
VLSRLKRSHAQQVQAVRVVRLDCQSLAVDALGFAQAPCPVMPERIANHGLKNGGRVLTHRAIL